MVRNRIPSMLLLFLTAFSLKAVELTSLDDYDMSESTVQFYPESVRAEGINEKVDLFYDKEGFFVRSNDEDVRVHSYDIDPIFKDRSQKDVLRFALGNKIKLKKFNNGEYRVEAAGGLKGGGVGGAFVGSLIGKGLVHFIGHGTILIIGACTGPAMPATIAALEAALLPTVIEPASNIAAIAIGVAGGVATGPV